MGTFAFLLGLPMLKSYVAFSAVSAVLHSNAFWRILHTKYSTTWWQAGGWAPSSTTVHSIESAPYQAEAVAPSALHLASTAS